MKPSTYAEPFADPQLPEFVDDWLETGAAPTDLMPFLNDLDALMEAEEEEPSSEYGAAYDY